ATVIAPRCLLQRCYLARPLSFPTRRSSDLPSLGRAALIADHGNKQVGDARRSHVAKGGKLLAFDTIEQQDAAPEHLAFMNRLQRSEEHTSDSSHLGISYAVFCLKKKIHMGV